MLEDELEKQRARAEAAEANYRFMVEHAADQKLDGYRALASRLEASDLRAYRLEAALREIVEFRERWLDCPPLSKDEVLAKIDKTLEQARAALRGEEKP
jgi:hypothetical protein